MAASERVPDSTDTLRLSCSICGKRLRVPRDYSGRRVRCPGCGQRVVVPDAPEGVPVAEPIDEGAAPGNGCTRSGAEMGFEGGLLSEPAHHSGTRDPSRS